MNSFECISEKFQEKPNLGGEELKVTFRQKLEAAADERFVAFKQENDRKHADFIVSTYSFFRVQLSLNHLITANSMPQCFNDSD